MKTKYSTVLINPAHERIRHTYDLKFQDYLVGKIGDLNLYSVFYSTDGIKGFIQSKGKCSEPILALHRQTDNFKEKNGRRIGLISYAHYGNLQPQDRFNEALEEVNVKEGLNLECSLIHDLKIKYIEEANASGSIACFEKQKTQTARDPRVYIWQPTLFGLEHTNTLIKYLAEPYDAHKREKLDNLLVPRE